MNIQRFHERILSIVVLVAGLAFAIFCGMMVGSGSFQTVGIIFGIFACVGVCTALRGNIWVLIPLFWSLTGSIPTMNLPFAIRDMAVMVVFGAFLVMVAFKIIHTKPKFDRVDLLILANILYLATVFARNPVGIKAFDSEMVGGKPYFNVFIGGLAYFVLRRVPLDLKQVQRLPLYHIPAPVFVAIGTLLTEYVQSAATALSYVYSEFTATFRRLGGPADDLVDRKLGLMTLGITGMQVLTSYFRPITLFIPAHFWRFLLTGLCLTATLLSGFRSMLVMAGIFIFLSTYFRRLRHDLLILIMTGAFGVTFLALGNNTLFTLPIAAQRTLSFLPGKWDYAATSDAQASIDWRVDMWTMVWNEDRWIRNKWLGDGFGFTRRELSIMESMEEGGVGFIGGVQQEAFMINGVFHNGPLSTIRFVGGVGLVLYYSLVLLLAFRALKLVRATYETKLFPAALFVSMPCVASTINYFVGYAQFDSDLPQTLLTAGILNLLTRACETMNASDGNLIDNQAVKAIDNLGVGMAAR